MSSLEERIKANTLAVVNGKAAVAQAITKRGIITASTDTFSVMASNISKLEARTLDIYINGSLTGAATWQIFAHGSQFTAATGLTTSTIKAMTYSLFSDIANPTSSSGYYTDGVQFFSWAGGAVYYTTFTTAQNSGTWTHTFDYRATQHDLYIHAGNANTGCSIRGNIRYIY